MTKLNRAKQAQYQAGQMIGEQTNLINKRPAYWIWLRFVAIFACLLVVAELTLAGNARAHDALAQMLYDMDMAPALSAIITALSNALFTLILLVIIFAVLEWPNRANLRERYKDGLIYSSIALIFSILIQAGTYYSFQAFGLRPLIASDQLGPFLVVIPILYLLCLGFLEYWLHRALHEFPFLWRFHSIHHQITNLNAAQSYSHFGEIFIYLLVITTPIILLVDVPQNHIALVTTFYLVSNYYMHSDSKLLSFPAPLRHIFADNIYHHYHHSKDVQHWGKNYSSFLSFYDRLFGTQYMPQHEIFPQTGIDDYRPIESIADYMTRPFSTDIKR